MIPHKITFLGINEKADLKALIERRVQKFELFANHILRCEVVLSCPHRHRHDDRMFNVQIHIYLTGNDIVINRNPSRDQTHTDPHVAIRDAFDAAERSLHEHSRILRREVKMSEKQLRGIL